jgi:hypothetical protein
LTAILRLGSIQGEDLLRKSIPIQKDGSILIPRDLVEEVFGKAREAVVHIRSECLVLSPIYVDIESGQLPQTLAEYHRFEALDAILDKYFTRTDAETVQFEGDLSVLSLNDVFLFLSASRKSGVLVLQDEGQLGFFFQNGNLVYAGGDDPRICLAAHLLKRQFVTEQDLVAGMRTVQQTADSLKALFEVSGLTLEEFREQWVRAVEEIIYSAFTMSKGRFRFQNGEVRSPFILSLPMSTTSYVMEATRRIDEWARIQDRLPAPESVLELAEEVTASTSLSFEEEQVLGQVTGGRTLQEVVAGAKVGEMEGKKAVASLIAAGMVRTARVESAAKTPSKAAVLPEAEREALLTRVENYNNVFSTIYQALAMEVGGKVEVILNAFFKGLEPGASILSGLGFTPDGALPTEPLLQNLAAVPEDREEVLVKDLNELLYFELFAVKNSLGTEMETGIVSMAKMLLHG